MHICLMQIGKIREILFLYEPKTYPHPPPPMCLALEHLKIINFQLSQTFMTHVSYFECNFCSWRNYLGFMFYIALKGLWALSVQIFVMKTATLI